MRKATIIILLIATALPALAQRTADYGVSIGAVSYLGDTINGLLKPGPAAQFFYRYNFNPRQAIRANIMAGYTPPLNAPIGEWS
ncbi:MAG: hypothetical protein U5L72_10620 [Bacteroidales bacterium]|nr:hypothetical protein [Bacteroidales bacterium]